MAGDDSVDSLPAGLSLAQLELPLVSDSTGFRVLRSGKYTRRVLGHSRVFGSPYGTDRGTPQLRTVLSGSSRRLLYMGTL